MLLSDLQLYGRIITHVVPGPNNINYFIASDSPTDEPTGMRIRCHLVLSRGFWEKAGSSDENGEVIVNLGSVWICSGTPPVSIQLRIGPGLSKEQPTPTSVFPIEPI